MSTFKNKNSLRTIEAQIAQKLKNNEDRPKFTGSYKKNVWWSKTKSVSVVVSRSKSILVSSNVNILNQLMTGGGKPLNAHLL